MAMAIRREQARVQVRAKSTVIPSYPADPFYYPLPSIAANVTKDIYMHSIYYFARDQLSNPTNDDPKINIESLKISLSETMSRFPVVAGRLRAKAADAGGGLMIKCNDGGMRFLEAFTASFSLSDWLSEKDHNLQGIELFHCEPKLMDYKLNSLALVQVTEFNCGGISIGLSWSHVMADVLSMTLFMKAWGEVHRGHQIKQLPSTICPPTTPSKQQGNPLSSGHPNLLIHDVFFPGSKQAAICDGEEGCREVLRTAVLRLSGVNATRSCYEGMELNAGKFVKDKSRRSDESFLSVTALLWTCICRARIQNTNNIKSEPARCIILRDNIKLPRHKSLVSERIYFGINSLQVVSFSDYQNSMGSAGELSRISKLLRETFEQSTDTTNCDPIQMFGDEKLGDDGTLICYWADAPFYHVEFKFGKPVQVTSGVQTKCCRRESIFLQPAAADNIDLHSSSSLEAVISLQPEHLQTLLQDEVLLRHLYGKRY